MTSVESQFGKVLLWRGSAHGFPRGWCSAQRIKIKMIAGGNHTIIY